MITYRPPPLPPLPQALCILLSLAEPSPDILEFTERGAGAGARSEDAVASAVVVAVNATWVGVLCAGGDTGDELELAVSVPKTPPPKFPGHVGIAPGQTGELRVADAGAGAGAAIGVAVFILMVPKGAGKPKIGAAAGGKIGTTARPAAARAGAGTAVAGGWTRVWARSNVKAAPGASWVVGLADPKGIGKKGVGN